MRQNAVYLPIAIVAAALLLPFVTCSGWCFYDAQVTYPQRIERWQAYEQIQQTVPPADRPDAWAQTARANHWPPEVPRQHTQTDILTQYIMGTACSATSVALALCAIICFALNRGRRAAGT